MHNRIAAATSVLFNPLLTPIATTLMIALVIAEDYAATTRVMLLWTGVAFTFFPYCRSFLSLSSFA